MVNDRRQEIDMIFNAIYMKAECSSMYKYIKETEGKICLYRGNPDEPEYLFIGEAPGKEENKIGIPFVGRAGKILNKWIKNEKIDNYCIINTVPIMPLNEKGGIRPPDDKEIEEFRWFTIRLINIINPDNIILLGRTAEKIYHFKTLKCKEWMNNIGFVYHPSYYMRKGKTGEDDFSELIKTRRGVSNNRLYNKPNKVIREEGFIEREVEKILENG